MHRAPVQSLACLYAPRLVAPAALGALLLAGCLPDLSGEWTGTCTFQDETYDELSFVAVQIDNGRGNQVEGNVTLDMFDDRHFQGAMTGIRSDTFIEMDAKFPTDRGTYKLHIDADVESEDEIQGTCTLGVPGGGAGAGLSGDLTLEL